MDVRASSQFVEFRLAGGDQNRLADNRKERLQQGIHLQDAGVQNQLNQGQENFENDVRSIVKERAELQRLKLIARLEQVAALKEKKLSRLKAAQEELLIGQEEKQNQLKDRKKVEIALIQDLALNRRRLQPNRFSREEGFLIQFGSSVCQNMSSPDGGK